MDSEKLSSCVSETEEKGLTDETLSAHLERVKIMEKAFPNDQYLRRSRDQQVEWLGRVPKDSPLGTKITEELDLTRKIRSTQGMVIDKPTIPCYIVYENGKMVAIPIFRDAAFKEAYEKAWTEQQKEKIETIDDVEPDIEYVE